jgi:hypothetical protein
MSKNVRWFWSVFLVAFVANNEAIFLLYILARRTRRKRLGSCCPTKHGSHIKHRNVTKNLVVICISRKVNSTGSEETIFFEIFKWHLRKKRYDADFRLNTCKRPKTYEPLTALRHPNPKQFRPQRDSKLKTGDNRS